VTRALAIALCAVAGAGTAVAQPAAPPVAPQAAGEPGTAPEPVRERSTLEVAQPDKKPIKAVVVENALGDVLIEGHDGPGIVIITSKVAPDDDTLDRLRVSLVPDLDGTYRIVTRLDDLGGAPVPTTAIRIDLIVRAPHAAHVDGRVDDGLLALHNMDAGAELDVASGRIEVKNVSGPVRASTVSAPMQLTEVFGIVDAQALAGDVILDTVRGDRLSASAHRGRIDGRRVRSRQVELVTTTGDVLLEGEAPLGAAILIASVRGTIDVRMRGLGGMAVRARGRNVDLGRGGRSEDGTYRALFGRGDRPGQVELRTRYGDIRFAYIE
jgi:hypothetical protein